MHRFWHVWKNGSVIQYISENYSVMSVWILEYFSLSNGLLLVESLTIWHIFNLTGGCVRLWKLQWCHHQWTILWRDGGGWLADIINGLDNRIISLLLISHWRRAWQSDPFHNWTRSCICRWNLGRSKGSFDCKEIITIGKYSKKNGNSKWCLPWSEVGGSRIPLAYFEKWFSKNYIDSFPDYGNVFCT